jgi:hypothetical protein
MTSLILESTLTCPKCGAVQTETMPLDVWQWYYECQQCQAMVATTEDDCCIFCSYGDVPCPAIQKKNSLTDPRIP